MKRVQIHLPEPLRVELRRLATRMDLSVAEIIRRAAEEFVLRHRLPAEPAPKSDRTPRG